MHESTSKPNKPFNNGSAGKKTRYSGKRSILLANLCDVYKADSLFWDMFAVFVCVCVNRLKGLSAIYEIKKGAVWKSWLQYSLRCVDVQFWNAGMHSM